MWRECLLRQNLTEALCRYSILMNDDDDDDDDGRFLRL